MPRVAEPEGALSVVPLLGWERYRTAEAWGQAFVIAVAQHAHARDRARPTQVVAWSKVRNLFRGFAAQLRHFKSWARRSWMAKRWLKR